MYGKPRIEVHPENCRGCRRCEVACSWTEYGTVNPRLAGIRIWKLEEEGKVYPVFNQTCLDRFCGKADPGKKMDDEPLCVTSCLFGGIKMAREVSESE
ncbi:MAG: hypothetical protein K6T66_09405 [Peptococcaceae bacterium]|nr:hypothetical protein [Peptococcaceae bacterium]